MPIVSRSACLTVSFVLPQELQVSVSSRYVQRVVPSSNSRVKGPRMLGERVEGQAIHNDRDHLECTTGQLLLSELLHSGLIALQERTYVTRTKSPNKEYLKTICILNLFG
jgi:hypothetical protein